MSKAKLNIFFMDGIGWFSWLKGKKRWNGRLGAGGILISCAKIFVHLPNGMGYGYM